MLTMIQSFFKWLMGLWMDKQGPTKAEITASNAVTQTELTQEITASDQARTAAQTRATTADRIMRTQNGEPAAVNLDPTASINTDKDAHYRD